VRVELRAPHTVDAVVGIDDQQRLIGDRRGAVVVLVQEHNDRVLPSRHADADEEKLQQAILKSEGRPRAAR